MLFSIFLRLCLAASREEPRKVRLSYNGIIHTNTDDATTPLGHYIPGLSPSDVICSAGTPFSIYATLRELRQLAPAKAILDVADLQADGKCSGQVGEFINAPYWTAGSDKVLFKVIRFSDSGSLRNALLKESKEKHWLLCAAENKQHNAPFSGIKSATTIAPHQVMQLHIYDTKKGAFIIKLMVAWCGDIDAVKERFGIDKKMSYLFSKTSNPPLLVFFPPLQYLGYVLNTENGAITEEVLWSQMERAQMDEMVKVNRKLIMIDCVGDNGHSQSPIFYNYILNGKYCYTGLCPHKAIYDELVKQIEKQQVSTRIFKIIDGKGNEVFDWNLPAEAGQTFTFESTDSLAEPNRKHRYFVQVVSDKHHASLYPLTSLKVTTQILPIAVRTFCKGKNFLHTDQNIGDGNEPDGSIVALTHPVGIPVHLYNGTSKKIYVCDYDEIKREADVMAENMVCQVDKDGGAIYEVPKHSFMLVVVPKGTMSPAALVVVNDNATVRELRSVRSDIPIVCGLVGEQLKDDDALRLARFIGDEEVIQPGTRYDFELNTVRVELPQKGGFVLAQQVPVCPRSTELQFLASANRMYGREDLQVKGGFSLNSSDHVTIKVEGRMPPPTVERKKKSLLKKYGRRRVALVFLCCILIASFIAIVALL